MKVRRMGEERRKEGTCTRDSTYDTERNWGKPGEDTRETGEAGESGLGVDWESAWRRERGGMGDDRNCYQKR
ncbi:hypothetical protein V501_02149 [Pseudogymnoascus sp. VKM F-4519 (FW-2642)]|nr:hypothetical protein V501_02149 [Pseudogymnoascus sp. VKM F-4519 (FW-2642)]